MFSNIISQNGHTDGKAWHCLFTFFIYKALAEKFGYIGLIILELHENPLRDALLHENHIIKIH